VTATRRVAISLKASVPKNVIVRSDVPSAECRVPMLQLARVARCSTVKATKCLIGTFLYIE